MSKSKNKSTKDSLTGIIVDFDGIGKVESDKAYSMDSPLAKYLAASHPDPSKLTEFTAEIELGKSYLVVTTVAKSNSPDLPSIEIFRGAWEGKISYKNNKINSALIINGVGFTDRGPQESYGTIYSTSGKKLNKPNSLRESFQALSENSTEILYDQVQPSPDSPNVTTGSLEPFKAFGGGKFFYDGWQTNPFSSDLI